MTNLTIAWIFLTLPVSFFVGVAIFPCIFGIRKGEDQENFEAVLKIIGIIFGLLTWWGIYFLII